ncbi:MAG: hypothetical protein ACFFCS_26750 [Candidatus Hodarchaeota archaeon]
MTVYPEALICRRCKHPIRIHYGPGGTKTDDIQAFVIRIPTRFTPAKALRRGTPEKFRNLYVTFCVHCNGILGTSNWA